MRNIKAWDISCKISLLKQPRYKPNTNPSRYALEQEKYRNEIYSILNKAYPERYIKEDE